MTPAEQYDAMADRIVKAALADVRRHYTRLAIASRCITLCEDAVEARRWTWLRLRWLRGEL